MADLGKMIISSLFVTVMPFYGDIFTASLQFTAKSLLPVLLSTLGIAFQ